jgi:antitoxin (DNA-binding transcriptional repressor) of toxin-antitoxin stability system
VIAGELRTMASHELRNKARLAVAHAEAGTPVMFFHHAEPAAVLINAAEAARWVAIERALSAFHGLAIYPELAADTVALGAVMTGRERPVPAAVRRLGRARRDILEVPRTIGITEIQRRMASIFDELGDGRPTAIYSSGRYVGVLITPAEYYRLRKLSRIVAWFGTAGLDLATADASAIAEFVGRFGDGSTSASESSVG